MKRVKFLFLAFLPVLLLSCGFVEKTKMENKVGEKFISELSDAGFSDIVSTCDILADLGNKESDGSYSGKIIITDAETGYSDALPICAWMDGEEVVIKYLETNGATAEKIMNFREQEKIAEVAGSKEDEIIDEDDDWVEEEAVPVAEKEPVVEKEKAVKEEVRKEEPLFAEEETVTEEVVNGVPSWLFGKWTCSTAYGTETMWISKDGVRSKSGNIEDTGSYTYSNGELRIQFSRERGVVTSIPVDVVNRRLEYGGGYYWVKSN